MTLLVIISLNSSAPLLIFPPFKISFLISATLVLNSTAFSITFFVVSSLTPIFFIDVVKSCNTFLLKPSKNILPLPTLSFVFNIKLAIILEAVSGLTASATSIVSLDILFNESSIFFPMSSAANFKDALVPSNFCVPVKIDLSLKLLDLNLDANLSIHLSILELLNIKSLPFCDITFETNPFIPTIAGMIGKPYSAPNNNLLCNCLRASSPAFSLDSLSNFVGIKLIKSPNVPMSSSLATSAPTPKPPPTVIPTNLSNLDNLFSLFN